jgi:hypothetical protein
MVCKSCRYTEFRRLGYKNRKILKACKVLEFVNVNTELVAGCAVLDGVEQFADKNCAYNSFRFIG